jgi:hypothetical protein
VLASKLRSTWTEELMDRAVHVVHSEAGEGINHIMTGWDNVIVLIIPRRSSGPVQVSKRGEM